MRNLYLLFILFSTLFCYSQIENDTISPKKEKRSGKYKNNEIKTNIPYLVFGFPEITYERLFKAYNGVGVSYSFSLNTINSISTVYIVTPYYRRYFGKGKSLGFFTEANVAYEKQEAHNGNKYRNLETKNFGLGFALGTKFINKKGYLGEAYVGFGKLFGVENPGNKNSVFLDGYPRLGFTFGKRF